MASHESGGPAPIVGEPGSSATNAVGVPLKDEGDVDPPSAPARSAASGGDAPSVSADDLDKERTGEGRGMSGASVRRLLSGRGERRPQRARDRARSRRPIAIAELKRVPSGAHDREAFLATAFAVVLRGVALLWLAGTVVIWGRMIGALETPLIYDWHDPRGPWFAVLVAALVGPVVAVGLWLLSPWGIAVWLGASAINAVLTVREPGATQFGVEGFALNAACVGLVAALAFLRARRLRAGD